MYNQTKRIMKAIKYLFMGVLMTGFSTQVMAQDGTKADIDAVKRIISSKPADLDKQMKPFYSKNKKNAENLLAFGRAFYEAKDTANARTYANHALKANKKYAPAYILLGDIEAIADNGGQAAAQYNQAIYFDPKNPDAYFKYANVYRKISPSEAIAKLEDLRAQRPDIAVDALVGRIYYNANDFDRALAAYAKADKNKMEERDLTDYAMAAYFKQQYQQSLDIAKFGLTKSPRDAAFNRLAFFNNTELGNFDEALSYADALFHRSDSAKFSYYDYTYYGNAYSGAKQYEQAIEMYRLALQQEDLDNKSKRAGVVKQLSEAFKAKEDYENAIKHYRDYLANMDKASAQDIAALAQLYIQHANGQSGDARLAAFQQADQTYQSLATQHPDAAEYATFMRARVGNYLDPEAKEGLAKPHYERLEQLIAQKADLDATDRARIIECYRYLISYYYVLKDDKATAESYAQKLIAIDPDNDIAKQVLGIK